MFVRRALLLPIAIVTALVAAGGCSAVLGIHDLGTSPQSACGLELVQGDCASCIAASCCGQASACAGDKSCSGYASCTFECGGDPQCRQQCGVSQAGAPTERIPALAQCVATHCSDACELTCGLPAVPSPVDAAASCADCITNHACSQAQTCAEDLGCVEVSYCQSSCTTLDCHFGCLDTYDGGNFNAFGVPLLTGCLKQCQLGQNWDCVGSVSYASPPLGPESVTFRLTDSTSSRPLEGIQVTACPAALESCMTPIVSATSDATGSAALQLRAITSVQPGPHPYYELVPPAGDAGAANTFPSLFFTSSPLSVANGYFNLPLISVSNLQDLAAYQKVTLLPTRGHIAVEALDCLKEPGSHVSFQVSGMDAQSTLFYLSGGVLVPSGETDISGFAFVFNVLPGTVTIDAIPGPLGAKASHVSIFTRAGVLSTVSMAPTQ